MGSVAKRGSTPTYGSLSDETRQRLLSEGAEAWQIDSYEQKRPWWACQQVITDTLRRAKSVKARLEYRARHAMKQERQQKLAAFTAPVLRTINTEGAQ